MAKHEPKIVIKLWSTNVDSLNKVIEDIKEIAKKAGVDVRGPIPLPTKRLKIFVRRAPGAQGRETYETWEMRVHKRLIEVSISERVLHYLMRLPIPDDVEIAIKVRE